MVYKRFTLAATGGDVETVAAVAGLRRTAPHPIICGVSLKSRTIIDWLSVTFDRSIIPDEFRGTEATEVGFLRWAFSEVASVCRGELVEAGGRNFYQKSYLFPFGAGYILVGGQNDTIHLTLTGRGCASVGDWGLVRELIELLRGRISHVDVALDTTDRRFGVEWTRDAYNKGLFRNRGAPPQHRLQGDWEGERPGTFGRTFYVGTRRGGRMLRSYEKGCQLGGTADRAWVRHEVAIYADSRRKISADILTNPDGYFAGSYPALRSLAFAAPVRISAEKTAAKASVDKSMEWLKRNVSKTLFLLENLTPGQCWDERIRDFVGRELPHKMRAAGYTVRDGRLSLREQTGEWGPVFLSQGGG